MARIANPKYEFNPIEGRNIPREDLETVRKEIKEFVLEKVLSHIGDGVSPVTGEPWDALSADYKKKKKKESSSTKANLELTGDMLDALDIRIKGNIFTLLVDDSSQAGKSDGHNNHSGKSDLPLRRFIPKGKQKFADDIMDGIEEIVTEYEKDGE